MSTAVASIYSLKTINVYLVVFGTALLLLGFPLTVLTGDKYHYYVFAAICVALFVLNLSSTISLYKAAYIIPFLVICAIHVFQTPIELPFILSLLPYFILPMVFFNSSLVDIDLEPVMKLFHIFNFINLAGVLLQNFGVQSPFLYETLTVTEGEYHARFGSFAGGTLALGLVGCITAIHVFYKMIYLKQKTVYNYLVLICAWTTLLLGLSRRFYLITLLLMIIIYVFDSNKRLSIGKLVRMFVGAIVVLGLLIYVLWLFKDDHIVLRRAFSVFNFEADEGNIERAAKWLIAFQNFLDHFWTGMGMGAMGGVGKNYDQDTDMSEIYVAESYYLKMFVEGGVVFGAIFLVLMFIYLFKSFKALRSRETALVAVLIILFFLDSIMGTSLEGPLGSMLFWIAVNKLLNASPQQAEQATPGT